jgi:hypothetical protein
MIDLERDSIMHTLSENDIISDFDCGDDDLNDFFNRDALNYKRQMLSRTLSMIFFVKADWKHKIFIIFARFLIINNNV